MFTNPSRFALFSLPLLLASCVHDKGSRSASPPTPVSSPPTRATAKATVSATLPANLPKTDVVVIGGTPSGVAAAVAAARQGAQVLLVEPRARLGGDIVYALLNMFDVPMNRNGSSRMAVGIFGEWFKKLGIAFDVDDAEQLIEATVKAEPNITLLRRTRAEPLVEQGDVVGVQLFDLKNQQLAEVRAGATVDATNDMDFAAKAGAKYFIGREEVNPDKAMQSTSLLFEVTGARWNALSAYVQGTKKMPVTRKVGQEYASDAAPTNSKHVAATDLQTPQKQVKLHLGGVDGNYIWERGDLVKQYTPQNPDIMVLSINFGRQNTDDVILNTVNVVGVNGLDKADRERAKAEAKSELSTFMPYLQRTVPGFKNAHLKRVADELYIRETRHLKGLANLTVEDIRAQKQFPDRIALASYPIDLHPYKKGDSNPYGPQRYFYTIPLRSLVPRDLDGLFVASRCLSASYDAAGSARVIPITMGAGQAAGVAASVCASKGQSPQELAQNTEAVSQVQAVLRQTGADIGDEIPKSQTKSAKSF